MQKPGGGPSPLGLLAVLVIPAASAIVYLTIRDVGRAKTGYKPPPRPATPPKAQSPISGCWVWLVLILFVAIVTYCITPAGRKARPAAPLTTWLWLAAPLVVSGLLVLFAYLKLRDPLVNRAMR